MKIYNNNKITFAITRYCEDCKNAFSAFFKMPEQLRNKIDIIVGDNGNNNDRLYKEDELKKLYNYSRFSSKGKYVSQTRLTCINHCKTKYIYFIDADDFLYFNELSRFLNQDLEQFFKDNEDFIALLSCLENKNDINDYQINVMKGISFIWNIFWKTDYIKKVLQISWNGILEEFPTFLNIANQKEKPKIKIIDEYILYIYNRHTDSASYLDKITDNSIRINYLNSIYFNYQLYKNKLVSLDKNMVAYNVYTPLGRYIGGGSMFEMIEDYYHNKFKDNNYE